MNYDASLSIENMEHPFQTQHLRAAEQVHELIRIAGLELVVVVLPEQAHTMRERNAVGPIGVAPLAEEASRRLVSVASASSARAERSAAASSAASCRIPGINSPSMRRRSAFRFSKLLLRLRYQTRLSVAASGDSVVMGRDCRTMSSSDTRVHSTSWGTPKAFSAAIESAQTAPTSGSANGGTSERAGSSSCRSMPETPAAIA